MEAQQPIQPDAPNPGMCGSDRDVFLRVWRRVMPEERPDCPVTVEQPEPTPMPMPMPAAAAAPAPTAQAPAAQARTAEASDRLRDDFPTPDDVPCLGSDAAPELERLQEFIARELTQWRAYQTLARRVSGPGSRVVSSLAGNCRQRAKRLSAAQFLISGVRFWPAEQASVPSPRSYFGALREHFLSEQNRGCAYRAAAEDCRDACLQALYFDLAEECVQHAGSIRALLEKM